MGTAGWIHDVAQDANYAVRTLRKSPGFTAVAVLTLALGIGANTAIFSVVDAVLLKPLPFRQPEKIVQLWSTESEPGSYPLTGEDYLDWRALNTTFDDMSLFSWGTNYNVSASGEPEGAAVVRTQANFFELLGVPARMGRTFAQGEDSDGTARVVLVSEAFWKSRLGGRPEAVGGPLELNGNAYTVIGVMPGWFRVPAKADLWVPLDMRKDKLGTRGSHQWRAVGRVKRDSSIEAARAELKTIAARIEKQFPDSNRNVSAVVTPIHEGVVSGSKNEIWIMFGAVALVLLIACANVANLLLARSTGRRREIAVRCALGAGRARLVRQLLTESVLLSLTGGTLGVALAYGGVLVLRGVLPGHVPQANPITVGLVPLLFALATCLVVGMLFGIAPAIQSTSVDASDALRSKGSTGASVARRGHWLRNTLVASEIALSLALLIGAGLLLRTFANLRATEVGVRPEHVLTSAVLLPENKYKSFEQGRAFFDQLAERLENAPGVRAAAVTSKLPLLGGNNSYIKIPGQQTESMTGPLVEITAMGAHYFDVMGIPLLAGRVFTRDDFELTARAAQEGFAAKGEEATKAALKKYTLPAVINHTMARTFWPKGDALAKVFDMDGVIFEAVGIVGDVKQYQVREKAISEAYLPLTWYLTSLKYPYSLAVRGEGSPEALAGTVRRAVEAGDRGLALFDVRTMNQIIEESMSDTRYQTGLLLAMAVLALVLAAVGTYGVMSYVVGQRTNEIGIRIALGAQRRNIMAMVLKQGAALAGAGIVVGLLAASAGARLMSSLLVGVRPVDPLTYASVALVLAAVALLACYMPVRRALAVDAMVALREE